jgi:hypothetical protein
MEKYFKYEEIYEENKLKHAMTRLKGHASLWWDELQTNKKKEGNTKFRNWDMMAAKFKAKFMPKYYQLSLFKKLYNLRHKTMTIKEYTK